jgi:hypothetical protein
VSIAKPADFPQTIVFKELRDDSTKAAEAVNSALGKRKLLKAENLPDRTLGPASVKVVESRQNFDFSASKRGWLDPV